MTATPNVPENSKGYTLSLLQAALLTHVKVKTIKRAAKSGLLSSVQVATPEGRELWFRPDEVQEKAALLRSPGFVYSSDAPVLPVDHNASAGVSNWEAAAERKARKKAKRAAKRQQGPDDGRLAEAGPTANVEQMMNERLEAMNSRLAEMTTQQHELLQAHLDMSRRYAELSAHSESIAAEAASYRERTAWLEGMLADANRELTELRALPSPSIVVQERRTPPTPAKPWWRRLLGLA